MELTHVQSMGTGPSGQNGGNVPGPVAVDSILDQEPVPIPARNMVGKTVREDPMRLGLVTRRLAQWMASGVTGLTGRPAQSCVVQVNERGPEPVPNRPQPMAENNALVEIGRHRSVMFNHAQVALKSLILPFWWMRRKA